MCRILLSYLLLLVASTKSYSQPIPEIPYCQIVATPNGLNSDLSAFRFGEKSQRIADSLLGSFKASLSLSKRQQLDVTDALNMMGKMGWELISVFELKGPDRWNEGYIYVLRNRNYKLAL